MIEYQNRQKTMNMKIALHTSLKKSDKCFLSVFSLLLFFSLSIDLSGQKVVTEVLDETWTGTSWQNSTLQSSAYDGSGYLTNSISQSWNISGLKWENVSQYVYSNNADGTAHQITIQAWDGISAWNTTNRLTYTYNSSKKVLTELSEKNLGAAWQNVSLKTNTYDGNGYLINSLTQSWDIATSTYKNSSQSNYTNNANGTPSQVVNQTWNGVNAWTNSLRFTYTYNASGKNLTTVTDQSVSGTWIAFLKELFSYDGSGYLINDLSQLWNTGTSTWGNSSQSNYTNNSDGTPHQVISQSWDGTSAWINSDRLTYTYSQITGVSELIDKPDFTIYPNPAHDVINVKANISINGSAYSITNQTGMVLLRGKITNENTSIDISSLHNGIYFVHFGETNQNTFKIIKENGR
jgi:hypothetical protein